MTSLVEVEQALEELRAEVRQLRADLSVARARPQPVVVPGPPLPIPTPPPRATHLVASDLRSWGR